MGRGWRDEYQDQEEEKKKDEEDGHVKSILHSRARLAARHQEGRPKEIIVIELQLTWGLRSEQQRSLHTNIHI
jgi:hypothetical protein